MVSPNASLCKEDKLLYPDHHLIWCMKSGFRPAHGLGSFSGEGTCRRFWFSVSQDLLQLLEDSHDWGLLEEPGHSFFAMNMSEKSPPSSLDSGSPPLFLPEPVSDLGAELGSEPYSQFESEWQLEPRS